MSRRDRWPVSDVVWTGPPGPVQLDIKVPLTEIREELHHLGALDLKVTPPNPNGIYVPVPGAWAARTPVAGDLRDSGADWRALALQGHGPRAIDVDSPVTAGWVRGAPITATRPATPAPGTLMLTPAAARCPATMALASAIPGRSERIRFLYLGPRGILPRHRDPYHAPRWEDRALVRFHVPIILPLSCRFFTWTRAGHVQEICEWPGSVWFLDTDAPHMIVNASTRPRIHLCVDKFLDLELRDALEAPQAHIEEPWDPDDGGGGI